MDVSRLFSSAEDHPAPVDVQLKGNIPKWLRGTYYKIGPGKFDLPGGFTLNHYFDGLSIIYQFKIQDGNKITFRARYVESDAYKKALAVGKPVFTEFGTKSYTDPSKNMVSRFLAKVMPSDMTDNVTGNLFVLNGRMYASTETSFIRGIDPETLETLEKLDMWKAIGINFCTSHYIRDRDGTMYNVGTSLVPSLKYHIFKIPPSPKGVENRYEKNPFRDHVEVASISPSWKTCFGYNHSFTITDNYIVYIEQPLLVNMVKLLASQVKGKSLKECMDWCPEEKTRFWLIDKATGAVTKSKYEAPSMFFYHFVNAYEDHNHVVIDILCHNTPIMCDKLYMANMRNSKVYETPDHPGLRRYVVPLQKVKEAKIGENMVKLNYTTAKAEKNTDDSVMLTPEHIHETGFDHPCINVKQCLGRKYKYFYAGGLYGEDTIYRRSVFKMDVESQEIKMWRTSEECILGEPLFLPNPEGVDEDDGIVLATVSDVRPDYPSLMVVLDAKTMTELARMESPIPLKVLNHSFFLPSH